MEQENTTTEVNVEEVVEETQQVNNEQNSNEPKTFTQEQVNNLIQGRLERQEKAFDKKLKEATTQAVEEYKASVEEDKRLANLSEKERLNEQLEKAQAQIKELTLKQQRADMLKETRNQLNERNINVSEDVLNMIATNDAESTQQNINAVENWLNEQRKNWEFERAKGYTPKSMNASSTPSVTKAQFDSMTSTERAELFKNNQELFKELTGGI